MLLGERLIWSKKSTPSPSPSPSSTQVRSADDVEGQPCKVKDAWLRNTKGEFTCMFDRTSQLTWARNFGGGRTSWTPLPTRTYEVNTYSSPSLPSSAIENCKIKENSDQGALRGDLASGFPFMPRYETYPKKMKMALLPIDFADLPGETNFRPRYEADMKIMADWFKDVSGGKLTIEWVVIDNWVRLPGVSTDYYVPFSGARPQTGNFWRKVLPVVDSKVDLAGVQVINFIIPLAQKYQPEGFQSFPFESEMKEVKSFQTSLISFTTAGPPFLEGSRGTTLWSYWAHEFGHVIGLAHVGSSHGESKPMNGMDLMGNQDGPYRELSGWMRFIIGWLEDSQVYCQDLNSLTQTKISLVPLSDTKSGIKMVVIPTSSDSAIIIESRRPTQYSCNIDNLPGGVLVYKYDAKLSNQSYFLMAQIPKDRDELIRCPGNNGMQFYPDSLLHTGDELVVGNVKISVTSSGTFDQIVITKN